MRMSIKKNHLNLFESKMWGAFEVVVKLPKQVKDLNVPVRIIYE